MRSVTTRSISPDSRIASASMPFCASTNSPQGTARARSLRRRVRMTRESSTRRILGVVDAPSWSSSAMASAHCTEASTVWDTTTTSFHAPDIGETRASVGSAHDAVRETMISKGSGGPGESPVAPPGSDMFHRGERCPTVWFRQSASPGRPGTPLRWEFNSDHGDHTPARRPRAPGSGGRRPGSFGRPTPRC